MIRLGHSLKLTDRHRQDGWVDPLAGIAFNLRLQTHKGDGVPLGLYSDEAGTIPAVEWDTVACWSDELSLSGLSAIQPNPDKRPILRFRAGDPVLEFDGIDDYFQLAALNSDDFVMICTAQTGGSVNSFRAIVDNANVTSYLGHAANEGGKACIIDSIGALRLGGSLSTDPEVWIAYEGSGLVLRQDGLEVINQPGTGFGSGVMRIGLAGNDSAAWDGYITAILFSNEIPPDFTVVESYLEGLQ